MESGIRSAERDQGFYQVGRPDQAQRSACQRLARRVAAVGQADHVVTEMRQHSGKVEAGNPFPCVLMLPRSAPLRCSKRKDPASIFGQTRRADHDLTHAFTVFVDVVREREPCYPAKRAKQSTRSPAYDNRSYSFLAIASLLCVVI